MSKNFPWYVNRPSDAQSLSTTSSTSAERARTPADRLQPEQREIRRDTAASDAPLEPAARHVIEHGEPVREVDGIVEREQRHARPEPDLLRQRQRLGEEQIGRRRVLPALGQVLAHPDLAEAELIGQHDLGDVALVAVGERAMRRVERHHEQAELHVRLLGRRGRRRAHAPDLDDRLLVLGPVVVDLASVVDDVAAGRHRHRALGIERLAGAHPPGAGDHHEEAVVGMEVRPAHVAGQPLQRTTYGRACSGRRTARPTRSCRPRS